MSTIFLKGAMPAHRGIKRKDVDEKIRKRFSWVRPLVKLEEDIVVLVGRTLWKVQTGFICDKSSWPFFLPRPAETDAPGIFHDALCRCMDNIPGMTWHKAAHLYGDTLQANTISPTVVKVCTRVLEIRGWFPLPYSNTSTENIISFAQLSIDQVSYVTELYEGAALNQQAVDEFLSSLFEAA